MKTRSLPHGMLLATVFAIATLVTAAILLLRVFSAQGAPNDPQPLRRVDFGAWSYTLGRDSPGTLVARVYYDGLSVAGLRNYAAANKVLADGIARDGGQADIQVTLRQPILLDEFRAFTTATKLTPEAIDLRTLDQKGARSTMSIFPVGSDPLPADVIDRQLKSAMSAGEQLKISGVVNARGKVDAAQLPLITADPRVFLADVTPVAVRRDLAAAGVPSAAQIQVIVQPPFWMMENLGLQNFR